MVIFKSVPVQVDFVCDSGLFLDFLHCLLWNSAIMPKVISPCSLNAWTIYYKITVKKASRVSPIEAIRYVEQDAVSIKRKKTASGAVIPRMAIGLYTIKSLRVWFSI